MQSSHHSIVSLVSKMLFIYSLVISTTESSRQIVKSIGDGVSFQNHCQTATLSSFLRGYGKSRAAKTYNKVKEICNDLEYSCCKRNEMEQFISMLKESFGYLHYRMLKYHELYNKINQLAVESFEIFLGDLNEKDQVCFNEIQGKRMEEKKKRQHNKPEIMRIIREKEKVMNYDKERILSHFRRLKLRTVPYLEQIKQDLDKKKAYYSGFVCTLCSPLFNRQMKLEEGGIPIIEVNHHLCMNNIEDRLKFANSLEIQVDLQNVLDLVYCARKNSKTEKDYDDLQWSEINLMNFDLEVIPDFIEKRESCLTNPNAFLIEPKNEISCREVCQVGLGLFKVTSMQLYKTIRAENELYNMFVRTPDMPSSKERYDSLIESYLERRKPLEKRNIVEITGEVNNRLGNEIIHILKPQHDAKVDFAQTRINISTRLGINVKSTPMDPHFYNSARRMIVFAYVICLLFKNNQ